jgi:hypothetical protein
MEWINRSVLEAVSWRLASELARRHPATTRLSRTHPGGGQSDCLWLMPTPGEAGTRLNTHGMIWAPEMPVPRDLIKRRVASRSA